MTKLTTTKKKAVNLLKKNIESGQAILSRILQITQRHEYLRMIDEHEIWWNRTGNILVQIFDNSSICDQFKHVGFFVPKQKTLQQEVSDFSDSVRSDIMKIDAIITDINNDVYQTSDAFDFSYDGIVASLKKNWMISIILLIVTLIIGFSKLLESINSTKENFEKISDKNSGEVTPSENLFAKVNEVYYLTDSSKTKTYPDAFKKDSSGVLISFDDITQSESMKVFSLNQMPIIKFSIINTNTTKSFKLIGVYIELNSKEYLLKISTQYDRDEPYICPVNSNIEYTGVPISYPVYKIEKNVLHLKWNPEEAQKLYPLYIQPTKPTEISGRLVLQFEDSTTMTFNQPFRINKKVIKDLKPGSSM